MESFEASGAAKRRRLTCPAMPADGVKVKGERSVESEVGPQSPGKGQTKTETNDLWLELKRQTEDMGESHPPPGRLWQQREPDGRRAKF